MKDLPFCHQSARHWLSVRIPAACCPPERARPDYSAFCIINMHAMGENPAESIQIMGLGENRRSSHAVCRTECLSINRHFEANRLFIVQSLPVPPECAAGDMA